MQVPSLSSTEIDVRSLSTFFGTACWEQSTKYYLPMVSKQAAHFDLWPLTPMRHLSPHSCCSLDDFSFVVTVLCDPQRWLWRGENPGSSLWCAQTCSSSDTYNHGHCKSSSFPVPMLAWTSASSFRHVLRDAATWYFDLLFACSWSLCLIKWTLNPGSIK